MKSSVRAAFVGFTSPLEGVVPFLYLDNLGLVSTAIGNLVDPKGTALSLPLFWPDGRRATRQEISEEWDRIKARPELRFQGGWVYKNIARLRLTDDGIQTVVLDKLAQQESELHRRFPAFESWPADAQLATLSMSWACGPWFKFPRLENDLKTCDFASAAKNCHINTDGPDGIPGTIDDNRGVIPRNVANKALYRNAAVVLRDGLDPEVLQFPADLDPQAPDENDISTGAPVAYQRALLLLGYDVGKADGVMGPRTRAAIKTFQANHNLAIDGIIGPKTQTAILTEIQRRKG